MKIPSLSIPTDSLYKFMTILGIVGTAGGFYTLNNKIEKWNAELIELKLRGNLYSRTLLSIGYKAQNDPSLESLNIKWDNYLEGEYLNLNESVINSLPTEYSKKFRELKLEYYTLEALNNVYKEKSSNLKISLKEIEILTIASGVLGFLGIFLWLILLQLPSDIRNRNELRAMVRWHNRCQSCSRQIFASNDRGTTAKGDPSPEFCIQCFGNGRFIEPGLTLDKAKFRLIRELKRRNTKKQGIISLIRVLKKSKRWKRETLW